MLINKETWPQHRPWAFATLAITLLLTASYALYAWIYAEHKDGGTLPGLIYGSVALAIMIMDSLLGARRKVPAWKLGRARTWLKAHIWISLLLFPLVFFHSAFLIGGKMTLVIWILFFLVMGSGILGVIIQSILPQLMTDQVSMETIYDQIDHITSQLRYDADVKIMQVAGKLDFVTVPEGMTPVKIKDVVDAPGMSELKEAYSKSIRPLFNPHLKIRKVLRTHTDIVAIINTLKPTIPTDFHAILDEIVPLIDEKRQLELQKTLHHWMHGWLFVHVPISFALLLLTIVHAVTALWY
ncbi:MAG: hypothetical protein IPJ69_06630 [Deltaproteobacteria bacterium]|nr:MAG: hypothetical protein IPJ69_06630 [Deltaproteobacteria bacterium]